MWFCPNFQIKNDNKQIILKKAIGKELRYPKSLNGTSNRVLGKMNNQKTSGNPHLKGEKNDGPS